MNEYLEVVLDELVPRFDDEDGAWDDALARSRAVPGRDHTVARRRWRRRLLVPAVALAVAGVALAVAAPWRAGPGLLDRAGAAITAPGKKQVIYMRYEAKFSGCCRLLSATNVRLWVEGAAPHHFRALTPCVGAGPLGEGGGQVGSQAVLVYDPRNNSIIRNTGLDIAESSFDPVAAVRQALASGTAHLEGRARIDGRQVLRIVLTTRDSQGTLGTVVYYTDPKTFAPVEIVYHRLYALRFPFQPVFGNGVYRETIRFTTYRYLPATPPNLKETSVRAEHPGATIR